MSAQRLLRRSPAPAIAALVLALLALVAVSSHGTLHGPLLTAAGSRWLQANSNTHPHNLRHTGVGRVTSPRGHVGTAGASGLIPGWLGFAALGVLAAGAVVLLVMRWRNGRRSAGSVAAAENEIEPDAGTSRDALRVAVDRSLAEVRADANARRAIIGAYRLMELTLERVGVGRDPAEAPREFLARALGALDVGPRAPRRLTALFERARFGRSELDLGLRDEAIDALLELRGEL